MGHGMMQADKTAMVKRKVPPIGPDDSLTKRTLNQATSPKLPDRDGPAKDSAAGKSAGKPKTSAKIKAMKASLAKMM